MPTRTVRFNRKSGREIETLTFWFESEREFNATVKEQKSINGAWSYEIEGQENEEEED